ncbi:hypothetical protein DM02DRAFT_665279 [Periconia macrospinosa]|uniref:Uncharacterized protein n=1 Tax=Periconia macrospinosa TaxID=97972 RepID=A0A2V1CX57_9PLEO|nr:hypothetical protein DM02DRAFT_665279 [Periconia macrospinosa]
MPPVQRDLPTSKIDPRLLPHVNCRFPTSVHRDESFEGDNQTENDNENARFLVDELNDTLSPIRTSEDLSIPEINYMEVDNMWESGPWVDLLSDSCTVNTVNPTVQFHESGAQHGERMLAMPISGHETVQSASMNESNDNTPDQNIGNLKRKRTSITINTNLHMTGDTYPVSREASRDENLGPSVPVLLMTPDSPNTYLSRGSNNRMGLPNHGLLMHDASEKMDVGTPNCAPKKIHSLHVALRVILLT